MGSPGRNSDGTRARAEARQSGGVVRHVDNLGRIVIPVEIRKRLNITVRDPLEIGVRGESIMLTKSRDTCVFCGARKHLTLYRDRNVCSDCRMELVSDVVSAR